VNSFDEYQIYQNRSIELVLSQHPSWTVEEATPVASLRPLLYMSVAISCVCHSCSPRKLLYRLV